MMKAAWYCAGLASVVFMAGALVTPPAGAQDGKRPIKCSSIMDICMKRAGDGHAGICDDMYSVAKNTGHWQATEEPDGTKHGPVPCTPN